MPKNGSPPVLTTDRVLQVLAVLAQQGRALQVPELMESTGLARSTLYRQLARLKRWGFVLEVDGYYAPGPLSLQLALGFDLASHLMRQARAELQALSTQSHESVGLVVALNDKAICLDMVESQQSLRCSFEKGRSVPLRSGASAKCLLAHMPEATRMALLEAHYDSSGTELQNAQLELDHILQLGYAVTTGEVDPGVWGVSAPLFGVARSTVGVITLMAPLSRAQTQVQSLISMTVVTAARISRNLSIH